MSIGYYVYIIGADGHVQRRINITCHDDEEAKQRARLLVDGAGVELWQEGRKVAQFDPDHD